MPVVKDLLRLQTDIALSAGEVLLSRITRRRVLEKAPGGEGRPVLLLPGYMAGDESLIWLRDILRESGFNAHTWGLGRNRGFQERSGGAQIDRISSKIIARVRQISGGGDRKVALVGQSFGGLYSRETAARYPDEIDRVITLGSPTIHPYIRDNQNSFIIRLGSRKASKGKRLSLTGRRGFLHWDARFPSMPMVAIWSPIDAVVFSQSARIPDYIVRLSQAPAIRENLRLVCSHSGMAFNEAVVVAVADRLVQPVDRWQPFDAQRYFAAWEIELVEQAFGNRLFHEFATADWRREIRAPTHSSPPVDKREPPLLQRLRRDHADFHRLYTMIEDSLAEGSFDEEADYLLLADVARFITDYLDRHHHPLEERLFEKVVVQKPASQSLLARLKAEHADIEAAGLRLLEEAEDAADPRKPREPEQLLTRWREFCEHLRGHVREEERVLFPRALEALTVSQWAAIERQWQRRTSARENPLSEAGAGDEFRQLFEYLSYVASRDTKPDSLRRNRILGGYFDALVYLSEQVDRLLERGPTRG